MTDRRSNVRRSLRGVVASALVPTITYPEELPIAERRDDLLGAIGEHQIVIVAGETGSGKSTQLPKLCLALGRGVEGLIGQTQPRRIAARTIAQRLAEELGTELGTAVGYTIRFNDQVSDGTLVKVMTDGILLAELQRDRTLSRYDTLIIDEAHERSLNIDFLLGYLKQLLPRRPDLKLIVTSATIDTRRFSAHFGDAPIIEVSGRTYPVAVRYRPFGESAGPAESSGSAAHSAGTEEPGNTGHTGQTGNTRHTGNAGATRKPRETPGNAGVDDERDQVQAICDAVDELAEEGHGDVLVFLSGEREIHDTADALRRLERPNTDVLPLYARLSAAEQHRIFEQHTGRRIVLATNVAETSLTVPGVRYVVDVGTARISRYSHRLKVQRLPIEAVSQASANQRAGRCGRVAPGICIRLYSEANFACREAFTEPEILRTNLASVILQMTNLGLGDVAAFPFLDPPDSRSVRDGVLLLEELGALHPDEPEDQRRLTPVGRRLAHLPIDPRLGRMVIEAERHGCVREVMIIAAALSIQDPRERPSDKQQLADESHRRFATEGSDFLALVKLWDYLRERQQSLSSNQFRKLCRTEYLNYLRVREWQDLFRQLREATAASGLKSPARPSTNPSANPSANVSAFPKEGLSTTHPDRVHQALLAGLLSHIGMRDGDSREFRGARNSKFTLANGSSLAKKPPKWTMAAELVETNRVWGRMAAAIQPEWAEQLGGHLLKRSYGEPRWDARSGRAVTSERVLLYGLPLVEARTIGYDRVNPGDAREMFIHHALVAGDWTTSHPFVSENRAFIKDVGALADRLRRWNLVDDQAIFAFYDQRVGADVVSTRHFDQWWKTARGKQPGLLTLTLDDLLGEAASLSTADFPDTWRHDDLTLPVTYRFEPGATGDGVTVHVPITVLNRITTNGFDWQVSGFREELVAALIRTLPKPLRRDLVPLAETSAAAYRRIVNAEDRLQAASGDGRRRWTLNEALAVILTEVAGEPIPATAFSVKEIPDHLRITFSIEDDSGGQIAIGKDLDALRTLVGGRLRAAIVAAAPGIERTGIVSWNFGDLPKVVETERSGHLVRGYPALLDDGDSVSIRVFSTPELQAKIMPAGVRRLMLLTMQVARKALQREVSNAVRLALTSTARVTLPQLLDDCITAAADELIADRGGAMWDEAAYLALKEAARERLGPLCVRAVGDAGAVVLAAADTDQQFATLIAPRLQPSTDDARAQLNRLLRPGFVANAGITRLPDLLRYVRGIERRLQRLREDPVRDAQRMAQVTALEHRYDRWVTRLPASHVTTEVVEARWLLEELRVGLFAEAIGTAEAVSVKRVTRRLAELEATIA